MHPSTDEPAPPTSSASSSDSGYVGDVWPKDPDGNDWDGKGLLDLTRKGISPFRQTWDVQLLFSEIESTIHSSVVDVPSVYYGTNNFGFHVKLANRHEVLARLSNADVNMPGYDGFSLDWLHKQFDFETAILNFVDNCPDIPTSPLVFCRRSIQHCVDRSELPKDISGRQLMVFEMTKDSRIDWHKLDESQKNSVIAQSASVRAALLNQPLAPEFVANWLLWGTFQPAEWAPKELPAISPTRSFCIELFRARIEALIRNEGDIIGFSDSPYKVGNRLLAAKQTLLRVVPYILPDVDDELLYRFVLQHDDLGLHNMCIFVDESGQVTLTSIYDWETANIVPVILSEFDFSIAGCDLRLDEGGKPWVHIRSPSQAEPERQAKNQQHAEDFSKLVLDKAPYLKEAFETGKDARHLWFAFKRFRADTSPDDYFGDLATWAESLMKRSSVGPHDTHPDTEGTRRLVVQEVQFQSDGPQKQKEGSDTKPVSLL